MERAHAEYDSVSFRSSVREDEFGFMVELGDGCVPLPHNRGVASVCLGLYGIATDCLSPRDIYLYVSSEDNVSTDATGKEFPLTEEGKIVRCEESVDERNTDLLRHVPLHSVGYSLVSRFMLRGGEAPRFGNERGHFTFPSMERACLAVAVQHHHFRATAKQVACLVLDTLNRHTMPSVFGVPLPFSFPRPEEEVVIEVGRSTWTRIVESVRGGTDDTCWRVWALQKGTAHAICVLVITCHWKEGYDRSNRFCIERQDRSVCCLTYLPLALGGGVLQMEDPDLDRMMPWWVTSESRRVPSELLTGMSYSRIRGRSAAFDMTLPNKVHRSDLTVLKRWKKSAESRGVHPPVLLGPVLLTRTVFPFSPGDRYSVRRVTDEKDLMGDVYSIFDSEFGVEYTSDTLERVRSSNGKVACFLVKEVVTSIVVGSCCVVLFECDDDCDAVMIDTFAVLKAFQGRGAGNFLFQRVCVDLVEEGTTDVVVFAQCVLKKPGSHFWFDKLDETGEARSLLFQAFKLCPELVSVQSASCCTPRARRFRRAVE